MLFWCLPGGGNSASNLNFPSWVDQYDCGPCSSWQVWRLFRFSLRNILVVAPVTLLYVDNIGGLRPLQHSPWGGGAPQSWCFFLCVQPPCWLALVYFSSPPFLCIGSHLSFKVWFHNGNWPIGAISQTPLNELLHNGLRHIGAIPPSLLNALLRLSLRYRWGNSYWPIVAISQTSMNALLQNGLRHLGAIPPFLLNDLL